MAGGSKLRRLSENATPMPGQLGRMHPMTSQVADPVYMGAFRCRRTRSGPDSTLQEAMI
ncbi:hypothetical protein IG631_18488 [Alternaria alternata]|nr:hypothetical protein IG631_18488 [Alternaria alternata]